MFGWYESAFGAVDWQTVIMLLIGGALIYLGIAKKMEPFLLIPIGFGIILVNIPHGGLMTFTSDGLPAKGTLDDLATGKIGPLNLLFHYGIASEIIPLLIFLGIGAMTDFGPAIARPMSFLFGATAQLGVVVVFLIAYLTGWFTMQESACVGIIGGSDGPPTVFLTVQMAPQLLGPITLAAYSYMALVPLVQPPVIRLLTSKEERAIYMEPQVREVSRLEGVLFPVIVFLGATLLVPKAAPLVGMLMFGNLLRASGVTQRLAETAGGAFIDSLTFILGLSVGTLMPAEVFFKTDTLAIIGLALVAFAFSTAGGLLAAKFVNLILVLLKKERINPMIGAAGVSAVPMSARVVQVMGQKANPRNFLLMNAMGPNMAGTIGTSVIAGVFLGMIAH
jgi:oxaloacetate decarboxylase beta subunit